jgi:hypothetical protein
MLTRIRRRAVAVADKDAPPADEGTWLWTLWGRWKGLAAKMGNYQGRLLLAAFYFTVITPWGILIRLLSDPLKMRSSIETSFWNLREGSAAELSEARRQF